MKFKIEISKDNIDSYSNYVTNKFKVKTETNTKVAWLGNMVWVFGILSLYSIYSFYDENCCSTFKELNIAILFMALTALTYWIWYKLYMKIYYNNQSLYDQISLGFWEIELDEEVFVKKMIHVNFITSGNVSLALNMMKNTVIYLLVHCEL